MGDTKIRRIICGTLLATAVSVATLAPAAADTNLNIGGQAVVAYTNGDGVNFRSSPSFSASVYRVLSEGTAVSVLAGPQDGSGVPWYKVQYNGTTGWIDSDYLARAGGGSTSSASGTLTVSGTNGDGLRLRSGASGSATVLTVMPEGSAVSVVGADKTDSSGTTWANVSYKGTTGYASRQYLSSGGSSSTSSQTVSAPASLSAGDNAQVVNTNGDGLNLRSAASYSSGVEAVAPEGSVVHVLSGAQGSGSSTWYKVDYKGTSGYMNGSYLAKTSLPATQGTSTQSTSGSSSTTSSSALGQKIASTALNYLGYPYAWAGTTPAGFDCSGFTYYIVNKVANNGFPRDMESQAASGTYVSRSNLQPGDLVFFQNTYKFGLSHSGIYIGNNQFVSAENESVGVAISDMGSSYWDSRYLTARRIG